MESSLRALLVEDSADDAELLTRALRKSGYDVHARRVETATEFSEAITSERWDVILSDFSLPGFGGLAALRILQESGLDLPFIIVSGTLGEAIAVEVMKAGAHDYFAKGHVVRLGAAIDREMREAARRRERASEKAREEEEREKLLQSLRETIAVRDAFLSIASHELRTPVTALQLQVQSLQRTGIRGDLDPRVVEARIATISSQVARLAKLVTSLLDATRLTGGHVPLSLEPVELMDLVTEELAALEPLLQQAKSDVRVTGEKVTGNWDRLRIQNAISNLLSNAAKFGEGKPVDITIHSDEKVARITVRDRGIGISAETVQKIFTKFERGVPREHYGGFGLGLWITKQCVTAHGGSIQVESLEEGSKFTIELPLQVTAA